MISLVTITHPIDPGAEVPFIGGRAPCVRIRVETRIAKLIEELGFIVEVHEENHDLVATQAKRAAKLAAALSASKMTDKTSVKVESKPEIKAEPAVKVEPKPEVKAEPVPQAEETAPEGEEASPEETAALRERIVALDSTAKAKAFIAEFNIELDASLTKLKDIKAALLDMIDGK